jgi:WD40 repeat protein/serine/threonine protein kinase
MSADEAGALDERLQALVASYEEALAAGQAPPGPQSIDSLPSELRGDLERLQACLLRLEKDRIRAGSAASAPLPSPPPLSPETAEEPVQLGPFQVLRVLGTGAFGVVYLAEDMRLGRQVALKVPRPEVMVTPSLRERFLREARAAARLHHTNIVPVFEVGEAGPLCYIVSAYCPGGTLANWLKNRPTPVPIRLAAHLIAVLADGVQHAHDRGILHRDLKPGNVLLLPEENAAATGPDGFSSTPLIADFGLAKFLDLAVEMAPLSSEAAHEAAAADLSQTLTHGVAGTPAYMAPEQAAGQRDAIGAPTDVYALGGILYQLLTGQPPFTGTTADVLRRVPVEEPVPPRRFRAGTPRDLEVICLKCLRKSPSDRYQSARDLAHDLRRWLAGEPVKARPVGALRRLAKWARRRPAAAGFLTLSLLTLTGLVGGTLWYNWARTQEERQQRRDLYVKQIGEAHRVLESGDFHGLTELLNGLRPAARDRDLRGFEWYYLWNKYQEAGVWLTGHERTITGVAFSSEGGALVSSGLEASLRYWNPHTGQPLTVFRGNAIEYLKMAMSRDGKLLATADGDGTVSVWDAVGGGLRYTLPGVDARECLEFSPDGDTLATGMGDMVLLWELDTRRVRSRLAHSHRVRGSAFAPDGKTLATAELDGPVRLWDTATGQPFTELRDAGQRVGALAYSPDGQLLVSGSDANDVMLWDTRSWKRRATLAGPGGKIVGLAFSSDGRELAVGSSAPSPGLKTPVQLWSIAQILTDQPDETDADPGLLIGAGSAGADRGQAVAVDQQRDIYVTGAIEGAVKLGTGPDAKLLSSAGKSDVFVARYSADGRLRWAQASGGPAEDRGTAIALDATGNVYIGGNFHGTDPFPIGSGADPAAGAAESAAFIVKMDGSGHRVWAHVLRGQGTSDLHGLAVTPGGGVYAAGNFHGKVDFDPRGDGAVATASDNNAFVLRLDPDGRFRWMRELGRSGQCLAHGIAVDEAGNVHVTGRFRGSLAAPPGSAATVWSKSNWDAFVAKLDQDGGVVWARRLGGPGAEAGQHIAVGPRGHVYVTGETTGEAEFDPLETSERGGGAPPATGRIGDRPDGSEPVRVVQQAHASDGTLYALDANNRVWRKPAGLGAWASANANLIRALLQLRSGDLFMLEQGGNLLRQTPGQRDWTIQNRDGFAVVGIAQIPEDGDVYWLTNDGRIWCVKAKGGIPSEPYEDESFTSLVQCPRGHPHMLRNDGTLLQLNSDGTRDARNTNRVINLWQTSDGTLYTLDDKGAAQLSRVGNDDRWELADPKSVHLLWLSRGRDLTAPRLPASSGGTDAFLARLTPDGEPNWIRSLGGPGMDSGHHVAVDGSDHVYVGGVFAGTAGLNATPGMPRLMGKGSREGLVAKFTGDGRVVWARALGGPGNSHVYGVAVDASGHVYGTGSFEGRIDFESGRRPVSMTSAGDTDLFVCRFVPQPLPAATFDLPATEVAGLAFAPDGRTLAVGCKDRLVRLWRPTRTSEIPGPMSHAPAEAWAVAFSPDGKMLASAGDDGGTSQCLKVWDPASGKLCWAAAAHSALVSCVAFSPDGRLLASGSYDHGIKLWEPATGRERALLTGHKGALRSVAFSPDGRLLASGGKDKIAHLWDVATGRIVHTFTGHGGEVRAVAFSPDGRTLVTADDEQEVHLWDVDSGRKLQSFVDMSRVQCVAYSPDGKALAWGMFDGQLKWRDMTTGQVRTSGGRHPGEIRSLAFTPDGRRIATGGTDGTVRLWDTDTGRELLALPAGSQPINSVAFSPAGDRLAAASHDGAIRTWNAPRR